MSDPLGEGTARAVLDGLRGRGCEVLPPEEAGSEVRVRIRLPDGSEAHGSGGTAEGAALAAAREAEGTLDRVQEASEESFPASDSPGY